MDPKRVSRYDLTCDLIAGMFVVRVAFAPPLDPIEHAHFEYVRAALSTQLFRMELSLW